MNSPQPIKVVKATFLSRKPAPHSYLAAFLGIVALAMSSLAYWANWGGIAFWLPAIPERVLQNHEYWRLFTGVLIHSDLQHLFSNCLLFSVLSYLLYGYFGWAVFPVLSLFCGGLTNLCSLLTYPQGTVLLGASGLVYWMAGFWLILYFLLDRQLTLRGRLLRCAGFILCLLVPTNFEPNISYRTHGFGFVLGVLAGSLYYLGQRKRLQAAEVIEIEGLDSLSDEDSPPPPVSPRYWN